MAPARSRLLAFVVVLSGCGLVLDFGLDSNGARDGETDGDADADTDSDSDIDADAGPDGDADIDSDSDGASDGDTDGDADADGDADRDGWTDPTTVGCDLSPCGGDGVCCADREGFWCEASTSGCTGLLVGCLTDSDCPGGVCCFNLGSRRLECDSECESSGSCIRDPTVCVLPDQTCCIVGATALCDVAGDCAGRLLDCWGTDDCTLRDQPGFCCARGVDGSRCTSEDEALCEGIFACEGDSDCPSRATDCCRLGYCFPRGSRPCTTE